MPLSDHERRLLAEMEAALQQDDPRLVSTMTGKARTRQSSRVLIGSLLLLSGMAILLTGLISQTKSSNYVFLILIFQSFFLYYKFPTFTFNTKKYL